MAILYIRAGASGNGSGSDWTNAKTSLTGLVRGNTYYLADGSYASFAFGVANSGSSYINIYKATASDHGTETGWDPSYGDGVATISGMSVQTGYLILDGRVGGGPGSYISGNGIF